MKRLLFALLHATRVIRLVAWCNRRKVSILCYHSVTDPGSQRDDPHKLRLPFNRFLEQLDYLKAHNNVISLSEFLSAKRERRKLPDHAVVLTFDDGCQDFYSLAAQPITTRGFPATVFLITHHVSGLLPPNGDTFLSWADVESLGVPGIEFGSHTCSHPRLLDLPAEQMKRELVESRATILDHVKQSDIPLSYPHGRTSEPLSRLVEAVGYSCGITTVLGPNGDDANLYALKRTVIASDDDLATFAARVSGLTWWVSRIKSVFGADEQENDPIDSCYYPSLRAESYDFPGTPG